MPRRGPCSASNLNTIMSMLPRIILKKGKEKPLLQGHPWVFSGAVSRAEGDFSPGDLGEAWSPGGQFLGVGFVNLRSQIIFRLLSQERKEIHLGFFKERMGRALLLREKWLRGRTNAYRMVNSEGDLLPGLIVDRYGEGFVIQCLTAGMERLKPALTDLLAREFHGEWVFERSDVATRKEEGLEERKDLLYGRDVFDHVEIEEHGCRFRVNVRDGQKTGFYLDQRENRALLETICQGKNVLDCFCYTGAFSVYAVRGGAEAVTLVDSSEDALHRAEEHLDVNRLEKIPRRLIRGDAFKVLRDLDPGYDVVILDPPPFAKKKSQLSGASRGYKDLNLQAFRLMKAEGVLLTFSCSHYMDWALFQKIVFSAAVDAKRKVQIIGRMGHPVDHPFDLCHPEGEYLKGFICRVF